MLAFGSELCGLVYARGTVGVVTSKLFATIEKDPAVLALLVIDADFGVASKSNYRQDRQGRARWKELSSFEQVLAATARAQRPNHWPELDSGVPLAQRPVFVASIVASTTLDAANVPKSVTDALEGVCYVDDAAVRFVSSCTRRKREPKFTLALAALSPLGTDLIGGEMTLARIGAELSVATMQRFAQA